jgi:hypothetical protein
LSLIYNLYKDIDAKKKNLYVQTCVWNGTQLNKKGIPQNDNSKIPKIKITTNPTTHPLTVLPFTHKKKREKKRNTNFMCFTTRWKPLLKMT